MTIFVALLSLLSSSSLSSSSTTKINRQFQFVDYGQAFSENNGRPTVSCDGRIPGVVTLELTHWTGNETPDDLYADTSTEMALNLAQNSYYSESMKNAWILNNHYDTDGVLSVFACLEPQLALKYAGLLIEGAEAGDFGEWSSDLGVKLDCALTELCRQSSDEETAFKAALEEVPALLNDLQTSGGKAYEDLWKSDFEHAMASWQALRNNEASLEAFNDDIAILQNPGRLPPISPYALHRGLVEKGLAQSAKRILHVSVVESKESSNFHYEKVGHGWVQKLIQRPQVPNVNADNLVAQLNSLHGDGCWKTGGGGLVSICQTTTGLGKAPDEVAASLAKYDDGLQDAA